MSRRRLDTELVRRKLVGSRTEAARAIEAGLVRVGANTTPKPSTLVAPEDPVHITGPPEPFVSRGGRKLDAAIIAFGVDIEGVRAIDVGASTGGFTDCLLNRGAATVTAVDVGHGQIHWRIQSDPRVTVFERMNIRTADLSSLQLPFDVVVCDVSFISLRTIRDQLNELGGERGEWMLLIKPQFEAGRTRVAKGGIVRDPHVRRDVLDEVVSSYAEIGLGCLGLIESPITGASGNVEYIAWFRRTSGTVTSDLIEAISLGTAQ